MSALTRPSAVSTIRDTIAKAAPEIREGMASRRQELDGVNPSGETVLAADAHADELLARRLTGLDAVAAYASEEREDIIEGPGRYHCTVDPLDGSSNVESGNPAGTIVGIYDEPLPARGRDLVAAGYVLYGSVTTMVFAADGEVAEYAIAADGSMTTLDANVTLPDDPTVYGFGGGDDSWPADFRDLADDVRRELKLRYSGALVADVNQVLSYGGIFAYPALQSRPAGKLRHQFEANPMAYIVESAGGASTDGDESLLDVEANGLHTRVPVHVGNDGLIDRVEATL